MQTFFILEEGFIYYSEPPKREPRDTTNLPPHIKKLRKAWKEAIYNRISAQGECYSVIFEGLLEDVYTSEDYLDARSREMEIYNTLCDKANGYNVFKDMEDELHL